MRMLGLSGVRRDKKIRTTIPGKDGKRAGDLLDRNFSAPHPNHTWVMDYTYVRSWAGWVYTAFIVDVFAQLIVGWHCQTTQHTDLVMTPLRMALWQRDRQGHPIEPGQLTAHSDAGAQGEFNRSSQQLSVGVSLAGLGTLLLVFSIRVSCAVGYSRWWLRLGVRRGCIGIGRCL